MNLFNSYFGKSLITDILYEDVVQFFSESRTESDKIEFKSSISNDLNGVCRAICGFLNSDGGMLIIGAPQGEKVTGKKEKEFKGELCPTDRVFEKDNFISRITDSITPAPKGVLFHNIEKDGKHVYIIDIPKSEYSPHQFQNVYYMRIDGQTKPAPHHYVEALMRKVTFPNLVGFLKILNFKTLQTNGGHKFHVLRLEFFIFNLSKIQNDYNLYCRLLGSVGTLSNKSPDDGWEQVYPLLIPIIHYGEPISERITVEIDPDLLSEANFEMDIFMHFGAKLSPMRTSQYKLKIVPSFLPENLHDLIIGKNENMYIHEIKEKNGFTDKQTIETFLGRAID